MKIITSTLVVLTALSVSIVAQKSSATEPVLTIKFFRWYESVSHLPCDDCAGLPQKVLDYRYNHRSGRGDFGAWVALKNLSSKTIRSVNFDFVFRDTATEDEFLTYHLRFDREIGRGQTKEIDHKIAKGKEADNFRPVGPSADLLERTRVCGDAPLFRYRGTKEFVRIRDDAKLLKMYPCYYTPTVTRIEYTDGSVWQP
jgi:hypothetical protein